MLGFIGGSGLNQLSGTRLIESKQLTTEFGQPSSPVSIVDVNGHQAAFIARHGQPHAIAPHAINYKANIAALKALGVTKIIAVNAVGGISSGFDAGVLCVPNNLIDYTYARAHTFLDGIHQPLDHIDFTYPYTESLRELILEVAKKQDDAVAQSIIDFACHAVTQGPRLETAAEIKRLAQDGCDIVGMTGMPEAALAREAGIDYACLACVVNPAAGMGAELITLDEIHRVLANGMQSILNILAAVVEHAECSWVKQFEHCKDIHNPTHNTNNCSGKMCKPKQMCKRFADYMDEIVTQL